MNLFPDSWNIEEARKVCSHIVDCINKTAPVVDVSTPYKMIRTTNVKNGRLNLDGARCVDEATFIKWNRRLTPQYQDIVLTREAPLGDVGLIRGREKVFLGQRTMIYRAKPEILDQHFLYYTLLGPTLQAQLKTFGSGSTVEHVRVPDAEKLLIPYPPIKAQKRIAAILSTYDDLIENNKRRIALLEKMAEEIYREWFVRFRFPGYQTAEFEKGIPREWQVQSIGSLCVEVTDGAHASPPYYEGGKFMASVKDMTTHGFDKKSMKTISENDYETLVKGNCKPIENDILIAKDGSYLKHVFVWKDNIDLVLLSSIAILRPDLKKIKPNYFSILLKQKSTKSMMSGYVSGSALPRIILKDFKKMGLLVPTFSLMEKFEVLMEPIYRQIGFLRSQNETLEITKNALLPRLISGKLSVEDIDIQFPPSMQEACSA